MEGQMQHFEGPKNFNPAEMTGKTGESSAEIRKTSEQIQSQRMEVWQKFGDIEEKAVALEKQAEEIDREMAAMLEKGIGDTIDQRILENLDKKRLELRTTVESLAVTMKALREQADDMRHMLSSIKNESAN